MKRLLLTIAIVALLAVPAMAGIDIDSASCPVNLKIMPVATVVAPTEIDVEITDIDAQGLGDSSGNDYGTFLIGTNLTQFNLKAEIGTPGLSGGTWGCMLQGDPAAAGFVPGYGPCLYAGPVPDGTPFDVYVQVTNVNMAAIPFVDAFVFDTTLTLTLSTL